MAFVTGISLNGNGHPHDMTVNIGEVEITTVNTLWIPPVCVYAPEEAGEGRTAHNNGWNCIEDHSPADELILLHLTVMPISFLFILPDLLLHLCTFMLICP